MSSILLLLVLGTFGVTTQDSPASYPMCKTRFPGMTIEKCAAEYLSKSLGELALGKIMDLLTCIFNSMELISKPETIPDEAKVQLMAAVDDYGEVETILSQASTPPPNPVAVLDKLMSAAKKLSNVQDLLAKNTPEYRYQTCKKHIIAIVSEYQLLPPFKLSPNFAK
ncbi:hypothetical protein Ciccas_001399 [Cichlidogyrus casuarinus]|uniref:Uncharacterized protein n=1 Tax=Cichlidogyrus casuarinus TaxID=1844966 RepID=A0ABD2QK65_9PLAT